MQIEKNIEVPVLEHFNSLLDELLSHPFTFLSVFFGLRTE
jgi:hypothetical protein